MGTVLVGAMLVAGGCLATSSSERPSRPTLLNPRWSDDAFAEHLNVLQGAFQGEEALAPVSRYVSASLREAWLQPAVEGRYRLRPLFGRPSGYAGYVGGKHPLGVQGDTSGVPVAQQAVIVCADLAGGEEAPVEAVALLEVARRYGRASQFTLMPERSVIFALWPRLTAQEDPLAGLRAYLERPTWRLDRVRAVLYVGLSARRRAEVEALLSEYGIPLYRVSAPPAETATPAGETTESATAPPAPVARARALAERTHQRLLAATLTDGKIMPALGDSIRVPKPEEPQQR